MMLKESRFDLRLVRGGPDLLAAQRLRYRVFVTELGGDGAMVDHAAGLERDEYDPHCDHLVLIDRTRDEAKLDHVVGAYRLLPGDRAADAGGFYTAREYDLAPLLASGRRLLELGRSCVDPQFRGGQALAHLWGGLVDYVATHRIEILFGVASFHGTDAEELAQPLSLLYHRHLAPDPLCVGVLPGAGAQRMDLLAEDQIDRLAALRATPALIKAYLRMGGFVGRGAYLDHFFNTTDVFLILDTATMTDRNRELYARDRAE